MDQITNAEKIIQELNKAIDDKNKSFILKLYNQCNVDWENEKDQIFNEYDRLVDQANDILFN